MQLDQTHVAIRLRTISEIGDLALIMVRRYPFALFVCFAVGALPWFIANSALLWWIPIQESKYGLDDPEAFSELRRYAFWMATLVVLQTPAAGVFTTYHLGQAVFEKRPTWKNVVREVWKHGGRWLWALGVKRLAVPAMLLLCVTYGEALSGFTDVLMPMFFLLAIALVRGMRPFMPEIILLEQCPAKSKDPRTITIAKRSTNLHKAVGGDLSGRFITLSFLLFWGFLGLLFTFTWIRGVVTGFGNMGLVTILILYPLALWAVAGFSVFIRFLNYLDTRIRLEGWEVDLAVRAEAIRQFGAELPDDGSAKPKAGQA